MIILQKSEKLKNNSNRVEITAKTSENHFKASENNYHSVIFPQIPQKSETLFHSFWSDFHSLWNDFHSFWESFSLGESFVGLRFSLLWRVTISLFYIKRVIGIV